MILQNHLFLADCQSMFSHEISDISSLLSYDHFLVLGGGLSGESAGHLLKRNGKNVSLADANPTKRPDSPFSAVFSDDDIAGALSQVEVIIKSPGIKPDHPLLQVAKSSKIPILSEIYLGRLFFAGKIIGITGTDGKSTTTALTHHLIKTKFPNSQVGGNLGLPFTTFCDGDWDMVVLELSSYQLEDSPNLQLTSSTILTLAPDHLERHKTMTAYGLAKWNVVNHKDEQHLFVTQANVLAQLSPTKQPFYGKTYLFGENNTDIKIDLKNLKITTPTNEYDAVDFKLPGYHNLQNLSVAIALAESVGLSKPEIQSGIGSFTGLPHRFQPIPTLQWKNETFKKIQFINDSKSTNLHSMLSGIAGYNKGDFLYLILGGEPKQESLTPFFDRIRQLSSQIYIYGKAADVWKEEFLNSKLENIHFVTTIKEALLGIKEKIELFSEDSSQSNKEIPHKTAVILSPACASFDQYKNFSERGEDFLKLVEEIFSQDSIRL